MTRIRADIEKIRRLQIRAADEGEEILGMMVVFSRYDKRARDFESLRRSRDLAGMNLLYESAAFGPPESREA